MSMVPILQDFSEGVVSCKYIHD